MPGDVSMRNSGRHVEQDEELDSEQAKHQEPPSQAKELKGAILPEHFLIVKLD